jgi:predicted GIY-YIG superfamily endonuclease
MLISKNSTIPYIGKTNNLERRLRQHNGEISGGAKRTRRAIGEDKECKAWSRILHVKGFVDERAALHFENRFQRERRQVSKRFANSSNVSLKKNPLAKGLEALNAVMSCDRPTRAARLLTEYGVNVVFENDEAEAEYNNMNGLKNVLKIQK